MGPCISRQELPELFQTQKERMDACNPTSWFKFQVLLNDPATWEPADKVPRPTPPIAAPTPPRYGWQDQPPSQRGLREWSPRRDEGWQRVERQSAGGRRQTSLPRRREVEPGRRSAPLPGAMHQGTLDGAFGAPQEEYNGTTAHEHERGINE